MAARELCSDADLPTALFAPRLAVVSSTLCGDELNRRKCSEDGALL